MSPVTVLLSFLALGPGASGPGKSVSAADIQFFEAKVRPLLAQHCFACHSTTAKKIKGGLLLDSRARILKGGESGPVLLGDKEGKSLLVDAVRYQDPALQMPPKGKLSDKEIALLQEWVRRGLPFPSEAGSKTGKDSRSIEEGKKFWSFRVPLSGKLPAINNAAWPRQRIDPFILAEMEKRNLVPSPKADRQTLLRRATFDLTGLPPTPEQVDAFINDKKPDAHARLIDRLLASPQYGERWGRFWLDLARYCDVPEQWSESKGQPWLYRDWVVQAFNDDMPYDQFVMKQLAADLMPRARPGDRAALGFLGLSPTYWKELKLDPVVIETVVAEEWEERIHAVTSTFLGLTVACARCHDHKFDPISMHDYYALAGVLASTRLADRLLLPDDQAKEVQEARACVQKLEKQIALLQNKKLKAENSAEQIEMLKDQVLQIKKKTPNFNASMAPGLAEASLFVLPDGPFKTKLEYKPGLAQDLAMQIRGNPAKRGPVVPRRFLEVLSKSPQTFTKGSGRLELAHAMVTEGAPLAARVIVNRIWKHHFGTGLVETPSDFGNQGELPSHPELLDDLTARFIHNGWSIKWLHREIMLSATYRQTSANNPKAQAVDPANRLLWRMNRRRLEVEAWRDAMLAASGMLNLKLGGPSLDLSDPKNNRRTLYGTVKRRELNDLLRLHDFPDPTAHSPNRLPTTTPLQQLFILNSPFIQQQAAAMANRLKADVPEGAEARIRRAYQLLFIRPPTQDQLRLAKEFLGDRPADQLWEQYAQVLLGSNEFWFVD